MSGTLENQVLRMPLPDGTELIAELCGGAENPGIRITLAKADGKQCLVAHTAYVANRPDYDPADCLRTMLWSFWDLGPSVDFGHESGCLESGEE